MQKLLCFIMVLFQLILLFLMIKSEPNVDRYDANKSNHRSEWTCNSMDTAQLKIKLTSLSNDELITVKYQYEICNQCDLLDMHTFMPNSDEFSTLVDSYYSFKYQIVAQIINSNESRVICDEFVYDKYEECGVYLMEISDPNQCSIKLVDDSQVVNSNLYLILAAGIVIVFVAVTNLAFAYGSRVLKVLLRKLNCKQTKNKIENQTELVETADQQKDKKSIDTAEKSKNSQRMHSLDTFRGISLFLMIFVNYGSGGFKFFMHVPWHGKTYLRFFRINLHHF